MKKLLILFVMAFAINVAAQESVLLRLNYKKGDSYVMKMKMTQDIGEAMSMDMNMTMSQKIISVTGGNYVTEMKISKMSMDMMQGGMSMAYDSSKSDDELDATGKMMKTQMEPMLKAVITAKGNNIGEVLETTVEPNNLRTADLAKQSNSIVYPKKAVRVGDTWTMTKSEKGNDMNFVYKVKSITNSQVLLDVSGGISGAAEGTIKGNITIDRNSGVPSSSKIEMDMSTQGQEIITSVVSTIVKQ